MIRISVLISDAFIKVVQAVREQPQYKNGGSNEINLVTVYQSAK